MKSRKFKITLVAIVITMLMVQGVISLANTDRNKKEESKKETEFITSVEKVTLDNIELTDEIVSKLGTNIEKYKKAMVKMDVQKSFQAEINRLILENYDINDILIAYEYLNINFGKKSELSSFVAAKKGGKAWVDIFKSTKSLAEFEPRTFNSEDLEMYLSESNLTTDDIMIADIVTSRSNKDYNEIIYKKIDGMTWKNINEQIEVLSSNESLPRVMINNQQVMQFRGKYSLSEDQVIDSFVIAENLNEQPSNIMKKYKAGESREQIYVDILTRRYK